MCQKFFWNESYISFYIINIKNNFLKLFSKQQATFTENNLEIVIECNKEIVDYLGITLNFSNGTFKPYHKTTTSSNMRNRTILQEQSRTDFQVLTCQQACARKTRHKRLTSEKDVNALWFYSSLYYVISLVAFTYLFSTDRGRCETLSFENNAKKVTFDIDYLALSKTIWSTILCTRETADIYIYIYIYNIL